MLSFSSQNDNNFFSDWLRVFEKIDPDDDKSTYF